MKNYQFSWFCSQRSIFKTNLRPKKERSISKYGKSPKEVSFFERSITGHPESATLLIVQGRKDELIRKHYEKLGKWKEMLADAQVAPQHPSTARASRSHIIQPYISPCLHILSCLILSYLLCPVLAPAPPWAQL